LNKKLKQSKHVIVYLSAAIQVYFVYPRVRDEGMFDLRQNESERVISGCERKHEFEVVEPRAAHLSSILNSYDSKAQAKLPCTL